MVFNILNEVYKSYNPARHSFDVIDQKLVVVDEDPTLKAERRNRLVTFLSQLPWHEYTLPPGGDDRALEFFYRKMKSFNQLDVAIDQKVKMQMMSVMLSKQPELAVTDEQLKTLIEIDVNFESARKLVNLFRNVKLPLQKCYLQAVIALTRAVHVQMCFHTLLTYATPWIEGMDHWSDVYAILTIIQTTPSNRKVHQHLERFKSGLDPYKKLLLISFAKDITLDECDNIFRRIPQSVETEIDPLLLIRNCVKAEREEVEKLAKTWNLEKEAIVELSFETRATILYEASQRFSKLSSKDKGQIIKKIPSGKYEFFSAFIAKRTEKLNIPKQITLFLEILSLLSEENHPLFFNAFSALSTESQNSFITSYEAPQRDKRPLLQSLLPKEEETSTSPTPNQPETQVDQNLLNNEFLMELMNNDDDWSRILNNS